MRSVLLVDRVADGGDRCARVEQHHRVAPHVDADLALAIAHDTEAHQDVEEVKRKVDALDKGERL